MLRKFSVENYRNFNEPLELDLTKVRNYTFNRDCIHNGLIGTAAVLGKNGCGKTNLGLALFDIVSTLTELTHEYKQDDESSFLNGFSVKRYATFRYEFKAPIGIIVFEYCKSKPNEIVYESLSVDKHLIFVRDGINKKADYSGLEKYGAGNLNMNIENGRLSVLRYVNNNTVQDESSPFRFVMNYAEHMLYFRSSFEGPTFIGMKNSHDSILDFIIENNYISDFQQFLKDVVGLDMVLGSIKGIDGKNYLLQKVGNKAIPFPNIASSGTFAATLFFYWMKSFNDAKLIYIDEFDAYYHHALAEKILQILIKEKDSQVLLTTHNTPLFSSKLLRADCCLYMRNGIVKSFADSTDMEIRQGHNLEKLYRGGEFDE